MSNGIHVATNSVTEPRDKCGNSSPLGVVAARRNVPLAGGALSGHDFSRAENRHAKTGFSL